MRYSINIKLRLSAFAVFIFCTNQSSIAQKSSKDYFLPKANKNKAIFLVPDGNNKSSAFERVIYYLKNESSCEVVDTTRYHNKPIRIEKRTVEFSSKEVYLIKLVSMSDTEKSKTIFYDPPKVIMRVPAIGQTLTWSYNEAHGQKTNFVAEWFKFKLNNVNTRAIRVTETITLPNGLPFDPKRIYYYMEGIGLWKMEAETRLLQQTICEFVKLE